MTARSFACATPTAYTLSPRPPNAANSAASNKNGMRWLAVTSTAATQRMATPTPINAYRRSILSERWPMGHCRNRLPNDTQAISTTMCR